METTKRNSYFAQVCYLTSACIVSLLSACDSKNPSYAEKQFASKKNAVVKTPPEFVGDWEKSYPFAVTNISISPDGRFKYRHQGCLGISFTEGKWSQEFNDIILDSDSIYNIEVAKNANTVSLIQSGSQPSADTIALYIFIQSNNIRAFSRDSTRIYVARKRLFIRDGKLADMPFAITNTSSEYLKVGEKVVSTMKTDRY